MIEIGRRRRNQPAPPAAVFESLTDLDRPGSCPWLQLRKRMNALINGDLRFSFGW